MKALWIKIKEMQMETERICLRPFKETDFHDFAEYILQKKQQRMCGNPLISTEEEARRIFERIFVPKEQQFYFAIEVKDTKKVIGNLTICYYKFWENDEALDKMRGVTLSFALNEEFWRQGIMIEVLKSVYEWLFTAANVDYINTGYFLFNKASEKLQEKMGMKPYRDLILDIHGEATETREMIIYRDDYLEHKLDRSIPFYNTILRCDDYELKEAVLPEGFSIVKYRDGFEKDWAKLEWSIEDFASICEAETYCVVSYRSIFEKFVDRGRFLLNDSGEVIGACIAWEDERNGEMVSSLHWLVVDERYRGRGLGKALCVEVMNYYKEKNALPVYIHTQPWSWKAILLYLSIGFRLQKTDSFSKYENEYEKAMATLKDIVSEKDFKKMVMCSED